MSNAFEVMLRALAYHEDLIIAEATGQPILDTQRNVLIRLEHDHTLGAGFVSVSRGGEAPYTVHVNALRALSPLETLARTADDTDINGTQDGSQDDTVRK